MVIESLDKNNEVDCQFVEDLYVVAFPPNERRPINRMYSLYVDNSPFKINVIKVRGTVVGFITYWDFITYVYAEHFSISDKHRNGGFGKKAIELFISKLDDKSLILEVEHPTDDLSERRIGFYQRAGFRLWDNIEYAQPPYIKGLGYIPMYLMTVGNLDLDKDIDLVKKKIFKQVYNIST